MHVPYSDVFDKMPADHKYKVWVREKVVMVQSATKDFKLVFEGVFAPHCPYGL